MAGGHDAIAAQRQADGSIRPLEHKPEGIGSIGYYFPDEAKVIDNRPNVIVK